MSHTSVKGFDGVSTKNSLVFGRTAAFHSSGSVKETKVVCNPQRCRILPKSCTDVPKILREATTWSPAEHKPMTQASIADMPEEVATQNSAPSKAASLF